MFTKIGIDTINTLTIAELDILRFIDNNKKEILSMNIQDLSKTVFFQQLVS
jgi:DNA-binding MurR/RpiR family transcriptional regulator